MKSKLTKITLRHIVDESPDTSYLGDYSDHPKNPFSIDRYGGKRMVNSHRYFNPCVSNWDGYTDDEKREYAKHDFDRRESMGNLWCYVGIVAKAEYVSPNGICQDVRSGGLWGIESDSNKAYLADVGTEQLAELTQELLSIGFTKRQIAVAMKDVETVDV